jgi:hypothetical protein
MVDPATVPVAVSGGLALLDLSCCAKMRLDMNNPTNVKPIPFKTIFFIWNVLRV